MSDDSIKEVISSYNGDYVIQEVLKQSNITSKFNPTSLNTFRISTLLLNGEFSVLTAMLRFGKEGSIVDKPFPGDVVTQEKFKVLNEAYKYIAEVLIDILKSITIESLLSQSVEKWHLGSYLIKE